MPPTQASPTTPASQQQQVQQPPQPPQPPPQQGTYGMFISGPPGMYPQHGITYKFQGFSPVPVQSPIKPPANTQFVIPPVKGDYQSVPAPGIVVPMNATQQMLQPTPGIPHVPAGAPMNAGIGMIPYGQNGAPGLHTNIPIPAPPSQQQQQQQQQQPQQPPAPTSALPPQSTAATTITTSAAITATTKPKRGRKSK